MKDEDEKTSLLSSASAPRTPAAAVPAGPSPSRPTLTASAAESIRALDSIERGAKRLAEPVEDTESVNGLLEGEDDWSVGSGMDDFWADGAAGRGSVTESDLEYLRGKRAEEGEKERMIDAIGMRLLDAEGDAELEGRILRKTLKLGDGASGAFPEEEEGARAARPDGRRSSRVQRVHESTRALRSTLVLGASQRGSRAALLEMMKMGEAEEEYPSREEVLAPSSKQIGRMLGWAAAAVLALCALLSAGAKAVGPPRLPVGEYRIVEAQVGRRFFDYYEFYSGRDSAGSNGYNVYVSREAAERDDIVRVVTEKVEERNMVQVYEEGDGRREVDWMLEDLKFLDQLKRKKVDDEREKEVADEAAETEEEAKNATVSGDAASSDETKDDGPARKKSKGYTITSDKKDKKTTRRRNLQNDPPKLEAFNPDPSNSTDGPTETFVYLSSSPTEEGPRNSIRLEGKRRFNRGLFIIDLRHMPAGCGTWPAFWLTDEANWPVNGEIDIVEGVNYQDTAKTALHTTKTCRMDDVPEGSKTGTWDTAVGIPDKKTGIPDMTFRFAQDCFVYDPHQWINQGCVATDMKMEGRSLGVPLNDNGGGVYALEWDPINTHIRTWVFSPHGRVPRNLRDAMRTATNADEETRVAPDTTKWGLPYGHFPIGDGTNCPSEHFRNMRLVINLAFCGSVSGTRYWMDCPKQMKKHSTCEAWVDSDPDELKEAYWKIRGVYVYEREWQKKWN